MASRTQSQRSNLDRYVVIHIATTYDPQRIYVTKDSAEIIELGWILLDAKTCDELHYESVLVKPINNPISLNSSLTPFTWEQVRYAGTFRDAINCFDAFASKYLISTNLDFSFVTLDPWNLRVQLPREARDKGVVLPPYLQYSRTFDLRTEYQRWQHHHPESLPLGSSILTSICAALEVEPVNHTPPFHLNTFASASPLRAMEEASILARVLRGLIRKSQPPHEHPNVLTRPMDANADVRAFLSERSTVLYMVGLPHDTAQSELENWFTRFGVVQLLFGRYERLAAASLCMNGRALNAKAIEVSPSSRRVLDRATETLTPFPPSKNRRRPGDWTCPFCGFSNFQRRTACFRCSLPAMGAGLSGDARGAYGCGYGPPSIMPSSQYREHHGRMEARSCGCIGGGGVVPFQAGYWKCETEGCGSHNFAKYSICLQCGSRRAGAAFVTDSRYSLDAPSNYTMGPGSLSGAPGPGPFAYAN